jgi:hypothetical protein
MTERMATSEEMRKEVRYAEEELSKAEKNLKQRKAYLTRQKEALNLAIAREQAEQGVPTPCGNKFRGKVCQRATDHGEKGLGWAHQDKYTYWSAEDGAL